MYAQEKITTTQFQFLPSLCTCKTLFLTQMIPLVEALCPIDTDQAEIHQVLL